MTCDEFTALCPVGGVEGDTEELAVLSGGAPDFGTVTITYVPDRRCVELKSLKLYLWSFRGEGAFHEAVTNRILDDLIAAIHPRRMTVEGDFLVRGGIHTIVSAAHEGRSTPARRSRRRP